RGDAALLWAFRQTPLFIEKSRVGDSTRPPRTWRSSEIDDCPIRQLGSLFRVGAVGIIPEIDPAVQDDVMLAIGRVGKDQDGCKLRGSISLSPEHEPIPGPFERERIEQSGKQPVG